MKIATVIFVFGHDFLCLPIKLLFNYLAILYTYRVVVVAISCSYGVNATNIYGNQ